MDEETVNFLAKFDKELWDEFKNKLYPYGYSLKDVVRDLIKIFIGKGNEVDKRILEEVRKQIMEE